MTSAQTVVRGQDWWMGREARISQKLRACSPAVSPHQAPALPRDAPPKNRENRENRRKNPRSQSKAMRLDNALRDNALC